MINFPEKILKVFLLILLSGSIYSQDINKKITVSFKNKPLEDVITEIGTIGNINFSYSPQQLPVDKKITIKAKNKTIKEIFDEIFLKNGIEYVVVEKQVVLKPVKKETPQKTEEIKQNVKTKYTISGYIKDKSTGEILIGAIAYIKGTSTGVSANGYGFYSLTLPEGKHQISYSFIGYNTVVQDVDLKENTKISTGMEPVFIEIKAVEITSENKEALIQDNQLCEMKLSPKTLASMPGFVGEVDVIKALQSVPGIKSYGDGSTLFYVRGGNSDQNLLIIDEAPIYNPSHLFGFFSAIAPDAIKDVEAYKGDFPANYGGRLSSVIDIRTKDGNMNKFGGSASVSLFTTNATVEGPIKKEKLSYFISARKSNLGWLSFQGVSNKTLAVNFYDFNTKFNYKLNNNNRFYLSFYNGKDNFSQTAGETFGITWSNDLGTFRWNHIFNDKLFSNTTIYSSKYNYYLYLSREQDNYWISSIQNSTIKTDFSYYHDPKNTIKAGLQISSYASNPGNVHFSDNTIQKLVPVIPKYRSTEYDFYICNEQTLSDKISLRYGIRLPVWKDIGITTSYKFDTNYEVIDTQYVADKEVYSKYFVPEPRFNFKYSINSKSSVKASYNRTTQFIQLLSNSISPFTSLEAWAPCGPNILPQKADQVAMGYFCSLFKSKYQLSVESFYKYFYNQVDYKDHANMLFNPLVEGELRFGNSYSYGIELMMRKSEGKFSGWLGYTYSRVFKQIKGINNDEVFPALYDRPNNICLNISYNTEKHWSFSASWVYLSGSAVTTPVSFYYFNGYTVPVYGDKNNDRLPDYHRLDISITCQLSKPERKVHHSLNFTLYNAYGRLNPIEINFNKIMDDNGKFYIPVNMEGDYELVSSSLSVIGFIPSITYSLKF